MDKRLTKLKKEIRNLHETIYPQIFCGESEKFIGFKLHEKDKFYLLFLSLYKERLCISVRENVNCRDIKRYGIESNTDEEVLKYIKKVIEDNLVNDVSEELSEKITIAVTSDKANEKEQKPTQVDKVLERCNLEEIIAIETKLKEYEKYISSNLTEIEVSQEIFSLRAYNSLHRNNVCNMKEFLLTSCLDMIKYRNFGIKSLYEVIGVKKDFLIMISQCGELEICDCDIWLDDYRLKRKAKEMLRTDVVIDFDSMKITIPTDDDKEKYIMWTYHLVDCTTKCISEKLKEREKYILDLRMGFSGEDGCTLNEIAEKLDISRERVRQIISKCAKKLKRWLKVTYIEMIDEISREELLNALCWGVLESYNMNFVKFILEIIRKDLSKDIGKIIKQEIIGLEKKKSYNERLIKRKENISNKLRYNICYPVKVNYFAKDFFGSLVKERDTSEENNNGVVWVDRFGELEYESLLEKNVIEAMNLCDLIADMKTQSIKIEYVFKGKKHFYYPDLVLLMRDGAMVIVEVKPEQRMYDERVLAKYRALKKFCTENGFGYAMLGHTLESIETLRLKDVNVDIVNMFTEFVRRNRCINYEKFLDFKKRYPIDMKETLRAVMDNEDIVFQQTPFCFKCTKSQ